jgi:hypothetical protein
MKRSEFQNKEPRLFRQLLIIGLISLGSFLKASSQEYFQQKVNYSIQVTLNDKHHELNAFETVEYINNSPDTLRFLYFHLWPNGYSNNETELAKQLISTYGKQKLFNDTELKGTMDSLDFKIDDLEVQWNLLSEQPDICRIILNKPLLPHDSIKITTPFHVKIPKGVSSRLGHIGESYQISQWYPKPAVYDQTGWHQMSNQDQGEFYSEFGSFDVSITLPANYIVGATGTLQNSEEAEMLDRLAADTTWIKNPDAKKDNFPPSSGQLKTLRYTENQIHDFAWFADKRFHVLKGKAKLPYSGREITTWVMFTDFQADLWKDAVPYVNNSIEYFSKLIGDYPYQSFTAVQSALSAGDGMEYPGITVIGVAKDAYALDEVIAHEIGHTWFYSALGSNERRFPFLDEGITSTYEQRYMHKRYPQKKLWETNVRNLKLAKFFHIDQMPVQQMRELEWLSQARDNLEQTINLQADDYTYLNYSLIIYNKTAMGFNYLRAYLGDSLFDTGMQEYYRRWASKHPQPNNLRKIFETTTGKDLSWFFSDFIGTTKRMDYEIASLENRKLLLKNKGELASPVVIAGMMGDSICFEKWVDGFEVQKWIDIPPGNYSALKIDPRHVAPEIFRLNNNTRTSGICPKADPIRTQLYLTLEDPEKRYIMYIPVVNWTREDGFMLGIALHNGILTPKPFEYFVMPFYTFNNPGLAGFGKIRYNITPYNLFIRKAAISLEGTQFGAPGNQNYQKITTGFEVYFRARQMNKSVTQKVYGNMIWASNLFQIEHQMEAKMNTYLQFGYQLDKNSVVNPYNLMVSSESSQTFVKTSTELNYRISYYGKRKGMDIRLFAGTMLKNNLVIPFYAFSPSGRSGPEQYLYEGTFPDRFSVYPTTFWSKQMRFNEGGLVSPVNEKLGYSRWLISISLTSTLPEKIERLPVKPFVNLLLNDHGSGMGNDSHVFCEAGLKVGIWDFFEISIPLIVSGNIENITGSFKDRIRFVFKLDAISQVKLNSGIGFEIR